MATVASLAASTAKAKVNVAERATAGLDRYLVRFRMGAAYSGGVYRAA